MGRQHWKTSQGKSGKDAVQWLRLGEECQKERRGGQKKCERDKKSSRGPFPCLPGVGHGGSPRVETAGGDNLHCGTDGSGNSPGLQRIRVPRKVFKERNLPYKSHLLELWGGQLGIWSAQCKNVLQPGSGGLGCKGWEARSSWDLQWLVWNKPVLVASYILTLL